MKKKLKLEEKNTIRTTTAGARERAGTAQAVATQIPSSPCKSAGGPVKYLMIGGWKRNLSGARTD